MHNTKMKKYKGLDPYGYKVIKTENQIRAWLDLKLKNYVWKIKSANSYNSKKKLETIAKDLKKIIKDFKNFFKEEVDETETKA